MTFRAISWSCGNCPSFVSNTFGISTSRLKAELHFRRPLRPKQERSSIIVQYNPLQSKQKRSSITLEKAAMAKEGAMPVAAAAAAVEKEVVAAAEGLVKQVMGSWDGSHDPFHAYRVRSVALSLAAEEGLPPDSLYILEILGVMSTTHFSQVELAALLHDIDDHKYASRGPREFPTAEEFLLTHGVKPTIKQTILTIIHDMGFKEELNRSSNRTYSPELGVVQDADRLDAMGAIGIGRTFTYGGSKNNAMHDPDIHPRLNMTKDEYTQNTTKQTTINHFHEKLLKLRNLMKTEAGKKRAECRHKFMEEFLSQFYREWDGDL